jgi:hypothetical protein
MAAMPQFSRLRIKQQAKKDSRQIRELASARRIFLNPHRAAN